MEEGKNKPQKKNPSLNKTMRVSRQERLQRMSSSLSEKKTQKSSAANRIMGRLQKKSETKSQTKPQEKPQKTYEVVFTKDIASIWEALSQEIITKEDVIDILLTQSKLEKNKTNKSLLDIMREKQLIKEDIYQKLSQVEGGKKQLPGIMPRPSKADFAIGQKIVESKLLPRQEIQQILRTQTKVHNIGIKITIKELLIRSKLISEENISIIEGQLIKSHEAKKQEVVEQKSVKLEAIKGNKVKKYPVMSISFALIILLLSSLYLFLSHAVEKGKEQEEREKKELQLAEEKRVQELRRRKKERRKTAPKQEIEEEDPAIVKQRKMKALGLEKWGKFWIKKEQKQELMILFQEGEMQKNFTLKLLPRTALKIRKNRQHGIVIEGRTNIRILPTNMSIHIDVALLHGNKRGHIFYQGMFSLTKAKFFRIVIAPLRKPIAPGIYAIKLFLSPSKQSQFIQEFFNIKKSQHFFFHISMGRKKLIEDYMNMRLKKIKMRKKTLERLFKITQKLSKTQKLSREKWGKWNENFIGNIRALQEEMKKENQILIPLFPVSKKKSEILLQILQTIRKKYETWHQNFSLEEIDIFKEEIEFEKNIESFYNVIIQEEYFLKKSLKDLKVLRIQ